MEQIKAGTPRRPDMIWDVIIQISGIALLALLFIAYFTGEEYPHTHVMLGYALAGLFAVYVFWTVVRPRLAPLPQNLYSLSGFKEQFRQAGILPRTIAALFLLMATLPLCAVILMLLTHTIWGATRIDEMHEVVAYFAVGLVVFYVAMVGIASIGYVEGRVRNSFKGNGPRN
jgi:cytochrome b